MSSIRAAKSSLLAGEVVIDGAFRKPGFGRDRVDIGLIVSLAGDLLRGCIEQGLPRLAQKLFTNFDLIRTMRLLLNMGGWSPILFHKSLFLSRGSDGIFD